jgi:RNA polymerase sigma-70 factor, ECF subfamily
MVWVRCLRVSRAKTYQHLWSFIDIDTVFLIAYPFYTRLISKEDGAIYVMSIDDKKRFTDIYTREADAVFRFCLIRVSDREKALDLTQETFTRLWNSIYLGKKVENPRAFLYRVARNLIIDWYRRIKSVSLESLSLGDGEKEFEPKDERMTLEIENNTNFRQVLKMLDNLETQYREVIYFRYVEDLSPKDIAEILRLNANTVSVRLNRGIEALRKLMGIAKNHHE